MGENGARCPHGLVGSCDDCETLKAPVVRLPKRALTIRELERVELGETATLTKEGV